MPAKIVKIIEEVVVSLARGQLNIVRPKTVAQLEIKKKKNQTFLIEENGFTILFGFCHTST